MTEALIPALKYLIKVIPFMALGIFLINLLENLKVTNKLSWLSRPVIQYGHLSEPCGISFITAFGSPAAAHAMLRDLYSKKIIIKSELIIAALSFSFPIMVMEWRYIIPILFSLLGSVGLLMFSVLFALGIIQTFSILTVGCILLDKKSYIDEHPEIKSSKTPIKELIKKSITDALPTFKRIVSVTIPVTVITFILLNIGFFDTIGIYLKGLAGLFPIPAEGFSVVVAYFGHHVAGYTMAGNLLEKNLLNTKEIILTLLTAQVLGSILFAIKTSMPYYIGIFGSSLGIQITLISTVLRNIIKICAIFVLFYLW